MKKRGRPSTKKESVDEYIITLETADQVFSVTGETALEAMRAIPLEWHQAKTKAVITLQKGTKTASRLLYLPQLRKLLANNLLKVGLAHNLEFLLKEGKSDPKPLRTIKHG